MQALIRCSLGGFVSHISLISYISPTVLFLLCEPDMTVLPPQLTGRGLSQPAILTGCASPAGRRTILAPASFINFLYLKLPKVAAFVSTNSKFVFYTPKLVLVCVSEVILLPKWGTIFFMYSYTPKHKQTASQP